MEELLLQAQAGLCRTHVKRHSPHKPALVREEAEHCMRRYPRNSVFWELYTIVQPHFQVEDRIRASLRYQLLGSVDASIISWSYAVVEEIRRCRADASGSTDHSVRSIFTNALLGTGSTVSHSLTLWTMWLRFEHPQNNDEMQPPRSHTEVRKQHALQRAKSVFLDGLRYLPWSKAWVVIGLQAFARDGGMHSRELRPLYDVLAERDLRVRVQLRDTGRAIA